jgi:hypothetical protein
MSKISSSVENIYDRCGCLLGTLLVILCVALALGIVFGVFCFEGWILCSFGTGSSLMCLLCMPPLAIGSAWAFVLL